MTTKKRLYKGTFNWFGEIIHRYTYAASEAEARQRMIHKLAYQLERDPPYVAAYFHSGKDNVKVVPINIEEEANRYGYTPKKGPSPTQKSLFPGTCFENR